MNRGPAEPLPMYSGARMSYSVSMFFNSSIAVLTIALGASACGERTSAAEVEEISRSLADVMVGVQRGADSARRVYIADSVSRTHGYDSWVELRNAVADVAVEPERLRALLDSTQKRIESRTFDSTQILNSMRSLDSSQNLDTTSLK